MRTVREAKGYRYWEREVLGGVWPAGTRHAPLTVEGIEKQASVIRKLNKIWRMNLLVSDDLSDYLRRVYGEGTKGWQLEHAVRGAKQCHLCGMMWDRDLNAARNIEIIFWYQRFHDDHLPYLFRRRPASSGISLPNTAP